MHSKQSQVFAAVFRPWELGWTTVLAIGAGLVVVIAFLVSRPTEPSYQGKRLSAWLEELDKPFETTFIVSFQDMPEDALEAIRNMGTNSLPLLLNDMQARDSTAMEKLVALLEKQSVTKYRPTPALVRQRRASAALAALGAKALPALPQLEKMLGDEHTVIPASLAVAYVGSQGVPPLTNELTNPNPEIRRACAGALGEVQSGGVLAVTALLASLRDYDVGVQANAAMALAALRDSPATVVPALAAMLMNTNAARAQAAMALAQYGPVATSAVPALLTCLLSPDMMTRLAAHNALKRIGAETDAIVTTLTNTLTHSDINLRLFAIHMIGSYGRAASNAVPALVPCLSDPAWVIQDAASNALVNVDARFTGPSTMPTDTFPP